MALSEDGAPRVAANLIFNRRRCANLRAIRMTALTFFDAARWASRCAKVAAKCFTFFVDALTVFNEAIAFIVSAILLRHFYILRSIVIGLTDDSSVGFIVCSMAWFADLPELSTLLHQCSDRSPEPLFRRS